MQTRDMQWPSSSPWQKVSPSSVAESAISQLNNQQFQGHYLTVAPFQRGKDHINPDANLYVKNITAEKTQLDLAEKFAEYGPIVSVKLEQFPDGKSKEYGYVQYERVESAMKAMDELNATEWEGKQLSVHKFVKNNQRVKGSVEFNNLYVKGFDATMTEEKLSSIFAMHGEATSVSIPDASKGFGYVCYKSHPEALRAIEMLNGQNVEGHILTVNRHMKRHERNEQNQTVYESQKQQNNITNLTRNLFVKGLPEGCTDQRLREAFE